MKSRNAAGKSGGMKWLVVLVLIGLTGYAFRLELLQVLAIGKPFLQLVQGPPAGGKLEFPSLEPLFIIFDLLIAAAGFFLIALWFISQGIMPVQTWRQRWLVFSYVFKHMLGQRGVALSTVAGRTHLYPTQSTDDNLDNLPFASGMVFVDPSSALILERVGAANSHPKNDPDISPNSRWLNDNYRVIFPGVSFFGPGEKFMGSVLLRKQSASETGVPARTSDGLEVKANVTVHYTLGQRPRVLRVAYKPQEPHQHLLTAEDLRIIYVNDATGVIEGFADELDPNDALYIHDCVQAGTLTPGAVLVPEEQDKDYPPYMPDGRHIYAALRFKGRQLINGEEDGWTSLPLKEAIALYRNQLATIKFDDLYNVNPGAALPLRQFRTKFTQAMRRKGILSFQYIQPNRGTPLEAGQIIDPDCFDIFEVQEFPETELLRACGIKIIYAGFSEPKACEEIQHQRVDTWRAAWQKETDLLIATQDLEVARIHNQAYVTTQGKLVQRLAEIFKAEQTEEILASTLFQTLDVLAAEETTRMFLPHQTLESLNNLRKRLLEEQDELDLKKEANAFPGDEK